MKISTASAIALAGLLLFANLSAMAVADGDDARLHVGDKWAIGTDRLLDLPDAEDLQALIDALSELSETP